MGLRKLLGLCEHSWNKWEYQEEHWSRISNYSGAEYEYTKQVQTRTCKICGKFERKVIAQ